MEYHVSKTERALVDGTEKHPFRSISQAAQVAKAGDRVVVHKGVYREWVNPVNGGTMDDRIIYEAAGDGEVIITGAEPIKAWTYEGNGIWTSEIPNTLFSHRNPFETQLKGDWVFEGPFPVHLGDVYLDGKSLYECESVEMVGRDDIWQDAKYTQDAKLKWYAEVDAYVTKIWANFGDRDPRKEQVEISVRPHCFFPENPGVDYITVRGFTMRQAAPQWAPPTQFQEGLIGPHWSKGWIIENNLICESRCVGISLGTSKGTGHVKNKGHYSKGGTQREQEVIFQALHDGWHKDHVGGHIIRGNIIHDCEQAGIVGHMGGAFSHIYKNRIFNIHHKRLRHGAEVAGIKLHAALDTQICDNVIYSTYRGIWLDWQAQGTRISRNIFFDNLSEDLFVEVCHGPYTVDHNLFLSLMNFRNMAQGGAFVHNLFAGRFVVQSETSRTTPYHFPHETAIAGYSNITSGDDRYYNNVFLGDKLNQATMVPITFFEHLPIKVADEDKIDGIRVMDGVPEDARCNLYQVGLGAYNDHPDMSGKKWWEYTGEELKELGPLAIDIMKGNAALPVAMKGNLYLGKSVPGNHEPDAEIFEQEAITIEVDPIVGKVKVHISEPELLMGVDKQLVTTQLLGKTYHADMFHEEADGASISFDKDFFGDQRSKKRVSPGPFQITDHTPKDYEF